MYVIREIMYCKPGKVGELVKKFKQLVPIMKDEGLPRPPRVMTDFTGEQFWTIVWEQDVESLDKWVEMMRRGPSDPRAQQIMAGYHDLVVSGKREIYKLEE